MIYLARPGSVDLFPSTSVIFGSRSHSILKQRSPNEVRSGFGYAKVIYFGYEFVLAGVTVNPRRDQSRFARSRLFSAAPL